MQVKYRFNKMRFENIQVENNFQKSDNHFLSFTSAYSCDSESS